MKIKIIAGLIILVVALFVVFIGLKMYTKSFSPQETVTFESGNVQLEVTYCRPFKKGRHVFSKLVPYGEVWRTGANEATAFTTSVDLEIFDEKLPQGSYSLWTVPGPSEWQIIFNNEVGQWGVGFDGKPNINPEMNQLSVTIPSYKSDNVIEQFTIQFEESNDNVEMLLMWENTIVVVPLEL